MSRKHFQMLAKALAEAKPLFGDDGDGLQGKQWRDDVHSVANVCERAIPNFNRARFIEACNG